MSKKLFLKIGSDLSNDYVIEGIDSFHLELFRDTECNVFITDLNSVSGTRVNSRKLEDYTQLNENDRVYLAENIYFDWMKVIEEHDPNVNQVKKKKDKPDSKQNNQKTAKREYFEIVVIYLAILGMIGLISLWF